MNNHPITRHSSIVIAALAALSPACRDSENELEQCSTAECDSTESGNDDIAESELESEESESDTAVHDLPPEPECQQDYDCVQDEGARFCVEGSCMPCSSTSEPNLACTSRDPELPICHDGECVACLGDDQAVCSAQGQICVPGQTVCGPCTNHDQCAGGAACDILEGVCFPERAVYHIDGDGGRDFLSVTEAYSSLYQQDGVTATFLVHELEEGEPYDDKISISIGDRIAAIAAPGERPYLWSSTTISSVSMYGVLYIRGVKFRGDSALNIGAGIGIVDSCEFYVDGHPNQAAIYLNGGGHLIMQNSMVRSGFEPTDWGAILMGNNLEGEGSFDIVDSTLVSLSSMVVDCIGTTTPSRIRNSLMVGPGGTPFTNCPASLLVIDDSAISSEVSYAPNNVIVGEVQADWFVDVFFDLHLAENIPLAVTTAGRWQDGDPTTDIDGDPRPLVDDSPDFAGADRIP
jgi:hypothetical protein